MMPTDIKKVTTTVVELANSIGRGQHLVFTEVMHSKLEKMLAPFMNQPAIVEVEETGRNTCTNASAVIIYVPTLVPS